MKKILPATLAITLALSLTACTRIGESDRLFSASPVSYYYTPQQNTQSAKQPITIYGNFDVRGGGKYRIQVGEPTTHEKALVIMMWLQLRNLEPDRETSAQYSRVALRRVPSYQVAHVLAIIEDMGVDKVWIQPEVPDAPCRQCLALGLPPASCPHTPAPAAPTQINNYYYYGGDPAPDLNFQSGAIETGCPPVPCNVSAGSYGTDSITLSWNSAGAGICYQLYYSTRNDQSCAVALDNPIAVAAVKIQGLCSGTNYYFWVTSVQNNQESEKSLVVSVTLR